MRFRSALARISPHSRAAAGRMRRCPRWRTTMLRGGRESPPAGAKQDGVGLRVRGPARGGHGPGTCAGAGARRARAGHLQNRAWVGYSPDHARKCTREIHKRARLAGRRVGRDLLQARVTARPRAGVGAGPLPAGRFKPDRSSARTRDQRTFARGSRSARQATKDPEEQHSSGEGLETACASDFSSRLPPPRTMSPAKSPVRAQVPVGPNRSVLMRAGACPSSTSHCDAASTNPVGPQM